MKKELNDKKLYMEPQIMVITLDCQCILAGSGGGNQPEDDPNDDGLGDEYYHYKLN